MAKPKIVDTDMKKESGKETVSSSIKSKKTGSASHVGGGDGPVEEKNDVLSRATLPLATKLPVVRKSKSKYTLATTFATPKPSKSQSIPDIPKKLRDPVTFVSARKSVNPIRINTKPRKSVTMLELRSKKPRSNETEMNYVKLLESFGTTENDGFDDKYKFLAYKTYCFMMKNAWKRAKDDRQVALEKIGKLQTSVLKTKTQLHVIKSLYHIERRHFDAASVQLHDLKQKVVCVEKLNEELRKHSLEKDTLLQKLEHHNEKLRRDLDDVISKANRSEIQLDRKRDEISQLKNDNEFLIKQRQEMEAGMIKRLNRYKEALQDTSDALTLANKELDRVQPVVDELEMKKLELDEYRYINELQVQEIDVLSQELRYLKESIKLKNRLKLIWNCMSEKKERNWYMSVIFSTFLPSLKSHDFIPSE